MIDTQLAAFLEEGVAIHLGTRNDALEPNGARAVAVQVEPDGAQLIVYIAEVAAGRLLPDLEANRQAVVFGRPTDDRACQVKGIFVDARPATADERSIVDAQWEGFVDKCERNGIPRASSAGWITWPAVAIRLRATAVFQQTPGPEAGTQLS